METELNNINNTVPGSNRFFQSRLLSGLFIFVIIFVTTLYFTSLRAPSDFPADSVYTIKSGTGLNYTADNLVSKNIVRSSFWFKVFVVLTHGPKGITAGDYALGDRENTFQIALRMASGDYRLKQIKVTFPEGVDVSEMSKIISVKLPKISSAEFVEKSKTLEGYLFPDTYLFEINVTADTVIKVMQDNFKTRISTLNDKVLSFGKPLSDIIKMASIVEEEARTMESRQIVAGILWRRLSLEMPLQVDASFKYINGKNTSNLTLEDLKIDSAYNSYLYKGLPPTPICNPGLSSITATLTPIKTNYLYFLTDKKGEMHYAKTYPEHLQNKELYLK